MEDWEARWGDVRRVLAIRLDNVGDIVMLGPALRTLRRSLPAAQVTLMASPNGSQAVPLLPWVDDVMVERVVWQDASGQMPLDPTRETALVERITAGRFDAALVFTSFSQSPWPPAYACYLAGVPIRGGQAGDFGGSLLTDVVPALSRDAHQVDRNLHLLHGLGFPQGSPDLEITPPIEAEVAAARLLQETGIEEDEPFAALAPGASCAARRYPAVRFADVATALAGAGLPVVVLGSPKEVPLAAAILERNQGRPVFSVVGRTSIPELAAVIARSAVVLSNDSGSMHLADALGRPVVVTFSGTDLESQWRPRRVPARVLRIPTPCAPCYRFDCPYDLACLDISPDEVAAHALSLLREAAGGVAPSTGPTDDRSGELCVPSGS